MEKDLQGKKILIVEDDTLLHTLLVRNMSGLQEKGVSIEAATDGEQALEKVLSQRPDLILLDLMLPRMNGFEFLEKVRANKEIEQTPVVLLTNLNTDADRSRAKSLGVLAYFVKADFSLSEITSAIEEFLEGKRMHVPEGKKPQIEWTSNRYVVHL